MDEFALGVLKRLLLDKSMVIQQTMLRSTFQGLFAEHQSFVGQVGHGRCKRIVLAPHHSEVQVFSLGSRVSAEIKRLSLQLTQPCLLFTLNSFFSIFLLLFNASLLFAFILE